MINICQDVNKDRTLILKCNFNVSEVPQIKSIFYMCHGFKTENVELKLAENPPFPFTCRFEITLCEFCNIGYN